MEVLRKEFHKVGSKGCFSIGWMDSHYVLIQFDLEEDYMRFWMKWTWTFHGYPLRVFKWSPDLHLAVEPSIWWHG